MWARFTVLNETPIASAIAGCVIPLSRSNTIWMRSRCAAGIFHRSAVFSSRICFLVHLTIRPPESDSQSESYPAPSRDPKKRQKSLDSNSYGSGITGPFCKTEHLGAYGGHGASIGAVCDPTAFSAVVEAAPDVLGPYEGQVVVDLVEAGCEPLDWPGEVVKKTVFQDSTPQVVIRIIRPVGSE